jgi:tetratricopeptide (TPR) repeat protein
MFRRLAGLMLAVLGTTTVVRGQEQHQHAIPEKLGKVSFATSCSPSVQEPFERGVALLHSFTYEAAERQFAEVLKADPNCAMAHWGASAITHWARAVGLARGGNPVAAEREAGQLKQCLEKARAAKEDYWAAQVEIQIAEANAWIAEAKGQGKEAAALMLSAAQEDGLEKRPITPGAIVPAREQLGELLLQLKQPTAALAEFEVALKNAPGRRGALAGALRAAELAGNKERARQ